MVISTAVDLSAVARVVGVKTEFKDLRGGNIVFLPQRIALIGQGNTAAGSYSTTKVQIFSAQTVGETFGFGSPLHLATLQLFPINGDNVGSVPVTIYPLAEDGSGVASVGDITTTGTAITNAEYRVFFNNLRSVVIPVIDGDTAALISVKVDLAINATINASVIATVGGVGVSTLTSKWAGVTANDIIIRIEGPAASVSGVTFTITQPTGGLVNPDVQPALDQFGEVWESIAINCLGTADSDALDKYNTFGEGRWGALAKRPLTFISGTNETDVNTAVIVPQARKTERSNCQIPMPSSEEIHFVIAAKSVARIAPQANNNPARDYPRSELTGLVPGPDGDQWNYLERNFAVLDGSSTTQIRDGVTNLSDTITFFHPDGDVTPAYRYLVTITKLQQIIFNLDLIFESKEWDGAPLLPDAQVTNNPDSKKPRTAIAAVAAMLDNLALAGIISDPEAAKKSIVAAINGSNPNRIDIAFTVQISGNVGIISIDLNFGFFFGGATVTAI